MDYDKTDRASILEHALKLEDKSLRQVLDPEVIDEILRVTGDSRGRLGNLVEEYYFGLPINSRPEPDFADAGVELKTSPLKPIRKRLVSKERIVLNIIDYMVEGDRTFETSSFWTKNKLLLLLFYLYEKGQIKIDSIFKLIRYWEFPEEDLKIIRDDWKTIAEKIRAGLAHELSESDTLYLGACTKGMDKTSHRSQKYSNFTAMQRAFSLKQKYVNYILDGSEFDKTIPLVSSVDQYRPKQTFEEFVIEKFHPFLGLTEEQLTGRLNIPQTNAKNKFNIIATSIAKNILGVGRGKIMEFEKAHILLKTVRVETSGSIREDMSFKNIVYTEIVDEEWEDSYWYETLNRRFFFVVFQRDSRDDLRLKGVKFWGMSVDMIELGRQFWEHTKNQIIEGKFEEFWRGSDGKVFQVRTKGRNSLDLMQTALGSQERKKCFWINRSFISAAISDLIDQ